MQPPLYQDITPEVLMPPHALVHTPYVNNHSSALHLHRLILPLFDLHISGIIQHVILCVWLLSLNIFSVNALLLVAWMRSWFFSPAV